MLRDSININNLCWNPVASSKKKKKIGKTSKNCFFWSNLHKKEVIMGHIQNEKQLFLAEITKAGHQVSETFWLSYESFSTLSAFFCQKSVISS